MTSVATIAPPELDELCVNTLRFLAVDAVQNSIWLRNITRGLLTGGTLRRSKSEALK
jgi:hypothetical protein